MIKLFLPDDGPLLHPPISARKILGLHVEGLSQQRRAAPILMARGCSDLLIWSPEEVTLLIESPLCRKRRVLYVGTQPLFTSSHSGI